MSLDNLNMVDHNNLIRIIIPKETRLRWSVAHEIMLLKEVLAEDPFEDPKRWEKIHENIKKSSGKNYSIRSVKDHVERLLKLFIKEDRANLRK